MNDKEALTGAWRSKVSNSEFLAADDFDEGEITNVIVEKVVFAEPVLPRTNKKEKRACAVLRGTDKLLILSVGRARAIAKLAGSNRMEKWSGTRIGLTRGQTRVAGAIVGCIDVTEPKRRDSNVSE